MKRAVAIKSNRMIFKDQWRILKYKQHTLHEESRSSSGNGGREELEKSGGAQKAWKIKANVKKIQD